MNENNNPVDIFIYEFFKRLKSKNIDQKTYESMFHLPQGTLSKWKKGTKPTIEQIKEAAGFI